MATISVQHLTVPTATGPVRDLSFDVADREFFVLTGPLNAGQRTALRAIAGLDSPTGGEIAIAGKAVGALPVQERDVAMVFPGDTLYPRLTLGENLTLVLKLRKFPDGEIKRRAAEAAEMLGIADLTGRKPAALSPAQRLRANLARAVARQPKVFLFDEPFAGCDQALRTTMRAELLRLHLRLQATFIYATSDPVEAMTLGNRIAILRDGALEQTGTPAAVYREPENSFIAAWLGDPAANLIAGKLRETAGGLVFKETGEGILEIKLGTRPEAVNLAGKDIVAAIRPESIRIATGPASPGAQRFKALLDVVEPRGAETIAHIETGAHKLIARVPVAIGSEEAGHRVEFEIDPATVQLFDAATNRRVAANA